MRHGFARSIQPNGIYYEGDYKEDKINGTGVFYGSDGDIYDGQWKKKRSKWKRKILS